MSDISDQKQKRPQVAVRCLDDENGEASSGLSDSAPTPVSGQWPTEPQPLTKDQYYDWLSTAYDIFLCAIPVFLAVKTTLCIVAEHLDKSHRGYSIDQLTPLTGFLIKFNEQVCFVPELSRSLSSPIFLTLPIASHSLHYRFRHDHVHSCASICSLQGTRRRVHHRS